MERRLFETGVVSSRKGRVVTLPFSLGIHAVVVTTALVIPVLTENNLPEVVAASRNVFFAEPAPIPAPQPPPPRAPAGPRRVSVPSSARTNSAMVAPPVIPEGITQVPELDLGFGTTSPDGADGGVFEGVAQPIVRGLPPVAAAPQAPQRPGGDIREPRKLREIAPVYPALAIAARIQGDVVLDCVISMQGRITDVTLISGPPLLVDAAREAARQWVYTPTLLNGVPIPILLRATVKFRLH